MIHDRKFEGASRSGRPRGIAARTPLVASVAVASLAWLAACGSSGSKAESGTSAGASAGSSTGASAGTSTAGMTTSGAAAGSPTSGSTSGTSAGISSGTVSMMDATMPSPEASTDDSSTMEAAPPVPTGEAGEPCNPDMSCGPGLGCLNGTTCVPGGDAGEPCTSGAVCDPGLACNLTTQTCVQEGDAGEPCGPGYTCDMGLYCNKTTSLCTVSSCAGQSEKALPYNISADFTTIFTLGPENKNFEVLSGTSALDCDTTTFPAIPNTGTGDASVGEDAGDAGDGSVLFAPPLGDGGVQVVTYATPPPCYEFLFDPSCDNEPAGSAVAGLCYAGAIFTNLPDAMPDAAESGPPTTGGAGVCIAQGATMVTFWARASLEGAVVKFGSTRSGQCTHPPNAMNDPVAQQASCGGDTEFFLPITTQWTQYAVSLPAGEAYDDETPTGVGVSNGFSVVFEPEDVYGGTYVFVKDIVWSNAPPASFTASMDAGSDAAADAATDAAADAPAE